MRPGIEIEATGGITLENVRAYAEAGADFVSIGALTHSVRAADLAIEVQVVASLGYHIWFALGSPQRHEGTSLTEEDNTVSFSVAVLVPLAS